MAWQTTHEAITKAVFGNPYSEYHRFRDEGWQRGLIHHLQIRHSPIGDIVEAWRRRDIRIVGVGLLHDLTDYSPLTIRDFIQGKYRRSL